MPKVSILIDVSDEELNEFLTPVMAAHPDWSMDDALRVATRNGMEEMTQRYRRAAERKETAAC